MVDATIHSAWENHRELDKFFTPLAWSEARSRKPIGGPGERGCFALSVLRSVLHHAEKLERDMEAVKKEKDKLERALEAARPTSASSRAASGANEGKGHNDTPAVSERSDINE